LEKITEAEKRMGKTFPAVFKLNMSRNNGGEISLDGETWWLFPFRDNTDRKSIRRTSNDIERQTSTAHEDGLGFPADGIAIGHNGAGDLLLLRHAESVIGNEVWLFRLRGGELHLTLEHVEYLWASE
jgi:hypothetical protein